MSKTPFKTPAASEFEYDPIEISSPVQPSRRPMRLRENLPGIGSSIEPSFAMDDSQQTKVITKATVAPKPSLNPRQRASYSLSVSSDDGENDLVSRNNNACKLPDLESGSPAVEENTPARGKKTSRDQNTDPPKRSARNKRIVGKKKPDTDRDGIAAAGNGDENPAPKRPLLSRLLSGLSEPGSLKWEDPLVGSRIERSPIHSDGLSPTRSLSPLNSAVIKAAVPPPKEDSTMELVDGEGHHYSPSIPAIIPGSSRVPNKSQANQEPVVSHSDSDAVELRQTKKHQAKSPIKRAPKKRSSPQKREPPPEKPVVPSKRRRGQDQPKKRVVQPRSKAKGAQAHQETECEPSLPITDTLDARPSDAADVPRTNSRTLVSETGSPTRVDQAGGIPPPAKNTVDSLETVQNEVVVDSPTRDPPAMQPPVQLNAVFQSQLPKLRVETVHIDSPQQPKDGLAVKGCEIPPQNQAPQGNSSNPSSPAETKTMNTKGLRQSLYQVRPMQSPPQDPGFEAFRQHILSQLTAIEARQQDSQSRKNVTPGGLRDMSDQRASINMAPQHMLDRVLTAVVEVSGSSGVRDGAN